MPEKGQLPGGAIFDQDGLLFDTEVVFERCWIDGGRKHGLDLSPAFVRRLSGCGRRELADIVARTFPGTDGDAFVESVHLAAADAQLAMTPAVKPGVREILTFCRAQGIRTAVASSSMRRLVDHNLAATGLTGFFDEIVTGRDVENGKPAPDIFLLAARRIGVAAADCVVFEDSVNGIRAAHAAGAAAVMIPDRSDPTPEIRALCTVYPTLLDALDALRAGRSGICGLKDERKACS